MASLTCEDARAADRLDSTGSEARDPVSPPASLCRRPLPCGLPVLVQGRAFESRGRDFRLDRNHRRGAAGPHGKQEGSLPGGGRRQRRRAMDNGFQVVGTPCRAAITTDVATMKRNAAFNAFEAPGSPGTGPRKISVSPKCWGSARAGSSTTFRVFVHDSRFGSFRPTVESLHPVSVVVERTNGGCSEQIPVGFRRRRPVLAAAASWRRAGFGRALPGLDLRGQEPGRSRQIARRVWRLRPRAGAPARRRSSISSRRRQRSTRSGPRLRRSVRRHHISPHRPASRSEPVTRNSGVRPVRDIRTAAWRRTEGSNTGA